MDRPTPDSTRTLDELREILDGERNPQTGELIKKRSDRAKGDDRG